MTSGVFSSVVGKEIRALLPAWAGALTIVVLARTGVSLNQAASGAIGSTFLSYLFVASGLLGFALGAIWLGAMSFGHEYSHGTLTLLLSQPIDRRRLFANKYAVLVGMVGTLLGVTVLLFRFVLQVAPSPLTSAGFLGLAVASGLLIAPWLSMLCRSALAGAVFAIGVPGLITTASDFVAGIVLGFDQPAAVDRLSAFIFWPAIVLTCFAGAAGAWRQFVRLELIDGSHAELQLPGAALGGSSTGPLARRSVSALRALVAKELRLQQMIFIIAAIFTVLWCAAAWREPSPSDPEFPFLPITVFYAMMLALLAGSLTSAQERQLGTLEWQALQPVAAWRQWLVKVGVAWTLVLTFGVALPAALAFLFQSNAHFSVLQARWVVAGMLALSATGIYLSSLCRASVTALVCSVPTTVAFVLYLRLMGDSIVIPAIGDRRYARETPEDLALIAFVGLFALLVSLAFVNHRRHESAARRLVTQGPAIVAYITAAFVVLGVLGS